MANLYKRKDSPFWWYKLPPIYGEAKPLCGSTRTADKRKARELVDKLKAQRWDLDKLNIKPAYTWEEAADRWLRETSHKRTHKDDCNKIRILHPYLGGKALRDISRDVIDHIKYDRLKTATQGGVNRYLALIRSILRKARDEWEMVDSIPKFTLFKESPGRTRALTKQEFERLYNELPEHLAEMALFSVATGLRQGNVKNLQWRAIDWNNAHLAVDAQEHKNGRGHGVPLNTAALAVLHRQRGKHPDFVFTYQGEPVANVGTRAWREALERANIKDFRWHDLRHTWATWQRELGTPTHELQILGGWISPQMVNRYAHVGQSSLVHAAKRMDNVFTNYILATPKRKGMRL